MMPSLGVVVVLALAAFRLTRLATTDTITDPWRGWLFRWAWDAENPTDDGDGHMVPTARAGWRTWAWTLATCQWCLGVWLALGVYAGWRWGGDVARAVVVVFAIAGAQGALAQFVIAAEQPEER